MQGQTNKAVLQSGLQRRLRRNMTDAERKLWNMLRGRQMAGLKFRRQHPFENYILDFVCLEKKIVVELDGGQHQENIAEDGLRTKALETAGFRVLRFWNHEVLHQSGAVVEKIWQELSGNKNPSSHPAHPTLALTHSTALGARLAVPLVSAGCKSPSLSTLHSRQALVSAGCKA